MQNTKATDEIPDQFDTLEAAAEWWDTHSVADHWDVTHEVEFDLSGVLDKVSVPLKADIARELVQTAEHEKTTVSQLVDRLLRERLSDRAPAA